MPASSQPGDTGQGFTFTFSSTTFAVTLKSCKIGKKGNPKVDVTGLSHTTKRFIQGDCAEWDEVEAEFYWDTLKTPPTLGGTAETGTITWPTRTTETTAQNLAGTGFFTELEFPTMEMGAPQMGKFKFAYDGGTAPVLTAAS